MAALVAVMLIMALLAQASPIEASTCVGKVDAVVKEWGFTAYGVKGHNIVANMNPGGGSHRFFLNSVHVFNNFNDLVEIGIVWNGGDAKPHAFGVSIVGGIYQEYRWQDVEVGSVHSFAVQRISGTTWGYYFDGRLRGTKTTNMANGIALASQERNEACPVVASTSVYALQRMDIGGAFSNWTNLQLYRDNDPDYCLWKPSSTSFYTQLAPDPDCNLSN